MTLHILFIEETNMNTNVNPKRKSLLIPRNKLVVSEANYRKRFEKKDESLGKSIEKEGIQEDIHVWHNKENDIYEILAGQRRFLNSADDQIPCILHKDITILEDAKKWCRREYVTREDLTPEDMLQITLDLKEKYGTLKEGCAKENLSYSRMRHWLKLERVKKAIREEASRQGTSLKTLESLSSVPQEKQDEAWKDVKGITSAEAAEILKQYNTEAQNSEATAIPGKKFYTLGVTKENAAVLEKQAREEGKVPNTFLEETLENKAQELAKERGREK
jgi:ParB-like chromosome segregation protein Spo0J